MSGREGSDTGAWKAQDGVSKPSRIAFSSALVISPHPDDAEFGCGGAIAGWVSEGKDVILCVVTNGAMGSNDPSVRREDLIATRE
ncbi:MAG: PIG-L deacetylase family protein, partial [Actinomycetota bacterium]